MKADSLYFIASLQETMDMLMVVRGGPIYTAIFQAAYTYLVTLSTNEW